jgi:N-methylhydantoinase A/oxoprolinase/acetone carboxylase beta subunit
MLVGVDVGGTFTDLVLTDTASGSVTIHKVSTTPADPSIGVVEGILEYITVYPFKSFFKSIFYKKYQKV